MKVSACLVTRGNVDMGPILDSIPFDDVIVWNNALQKDFGLYGRYEAITEAKHDVIVTQDDDLIVTCWPELLEAYRPGILVCNYPEPWDIPWVARGAIFDRDLPRKAFETYLESHRFDHDFTHYLCDGIFGLLTPTHVVDYGSEDLPYCNDGGRISTSPGWYDDKRRLIQSRCAEL